MPAWIVLGFWFVYQILLNHFSGMGQFSGGVAYMAHIGGFIAGMILVRVLAPMRHESELTGGAWNPWR